MAKYCSRPFHYLYLDNSYGDVYFCPWMESKKSKIGNILEQTLDEIWQGEVAENLRNSFRENCFSFCRAQACPCLQNNDLPEVADVEEFKRLSLPLERPTAINIAYDSICNQYCETCRKEPFVPRGDYKERIVKIQERIAPYFDNAHYISMSGHGDPFASPYIMDVLANMRPVNKELMLVLETNGVFFDEAHWERIKHLGEVNFIIAMTINSFDEFTYNHISRGGNYKKLMHNLEFIKNLKQQGSIKEYTNALVIQDRNFREIPSFVERSLNEFGFDRVYLKPVYQWGKMEPEVYWFKDVLNPKHPYHTEYLEILKHPILNDPRVYNFGGHSEHPAVDYPAKS